MRSIPSLKLRSKARRPRSSRFPPRLRRRRQPESNRAFGNLSTFIFLSECALHSSKLFWKDCTSSIMFKVLDSAVPVACWSCSIGHNDSTLFCPHCSKIQPPPGGDYFSVFGLEPRLNLDLPALEHEFHRLSRKLHPDRFARAEENEKEWSLADTALLNDAYRTLKDPLRRTEYLLKLLGAEMDPTNPKKKRTRACRRSARRSLRVEYANRRDAHESQDGRRRSRLWKRL